MKNVARFSEVAKGQIASKLLTSLFISSKGEVRRRQNTDDLLSVKMEKNDRQARALTQRVDSKGDPNLKGRKEWG